MRIHIPFSGFSVSVACKESIEDYPVGGVFADLLRVVLKIERKRPYIAVHLLWLVVGVGWL